MHPSICHTPIYLHFFWPWKCDKSGTWRISENKMCDLIRNNRHFSENFVFLSTDFVDFINYFSIFCSFFVCFENELMLSQFLKFTRKYIRMKSFTDPICHISPDLSPKPDLFPLFLSWRCNKSKDAQYFTLI